MNCNDLILQNYKHSSNIYFPCSKYAQNYSEVKELITFYSGSLKRGKIKERYTHSVLTINPIQWGVQKKMQLSKAI